MKKKLIIVLSVLIIILTTCLIIYPIYKEKKEIKKLYLEVSVINNYLIGNETKENVDVILNNDSVTDYRKDVSLAIKKYSTDLIKEIDEYKEIKNNKENELLINNLKKKEDIDNYLTLLSKNNTKLKEIKDKVQEIEKNKDSYLSSKEEKDIKLYHDLLSQINMSDEKMNQEIELLESNHTVASYLGNNLNTWKEDNNGITFLKRKNYNEFQDKKISSLEYHLIDDKTPPVITASNISITKGSKLNVKDKVKCVDEVDGVVDCNISGNYDTNKIGTYKLTISSVDTEKNKSEKTINISVKAKKVNKKPYYIEVIRNKNVVVVYGLDDNNEYKKIVKVFICSVGLNNKTPLGTYNTTKGYAWGWLVGGLYGQYSTRIVGSILFHSVPYLKEDKSTLEWEEYNKLGQAASKGCIRMTVRDVKWIFDNCPVGTTVKIYDGELPSGVSKPGFTKINGSSPNRGWDPTDPDKNNPWH